MDSSVVLRWTVAALHLLALGIGFAGIWARSRALRGTLDTDGIRRVLGADTLWGIAAVLWIATGVARAFGGLEKGAAYYVHEPAFQVKMTLFIAIIVLEMWPMAAFIRWRMRLAQHATPDTSRARTFAIIGDVQTLLLIGMIFAATALARGLFH